MTNRDDLGNAMLERVNGIRDVLSERITSQGRQINDRVDNVTLAMSEMRSEFKSEIDEILKGVKTIERQQGTLAEIMAEHTRALSANTARWEEHMKASAERDRKIGILEKAHRQGADVVGFLRTEWQVILALAAAVSLIFNVYLGGQHIGIW